MPRRLIRTDVTRHFSKLWGEAKNTPWGEIRHDPIESTKARLLEPFLGPKGTVLDLGCGGGDFLAHVLAPAEPFAEVVGVDVSSVALERARRTGKYDRLIQANIDDVAQRVTQKFSVVLLGEVLYYLRDYAETLAVATDRVASQGLLFLSLACGPRFFGSKDVTIIKDFLFRRGFQSLVDEQLDYKTAFGLPRRYLAPLYQQTLKHVLIYREGPPSAQSEGGVAYPTVEKDGPGPPAAQPPKPPTRSMRMS